MHEVLEKQKQNQSKIHKQQYLYQSIHHVFQYEIRANTEILIMQELKCLIIKTLYFDYIAIYIYIYKY